MSLPLILLLCIIPAIAFWISGRAAAENAILHSREACKQAGVQWLDQSVHQLRVRLRRNAEGRLCWERQFRFEYSHGGDDRHAGLITMLGSQMSSLVGPMRVVEPVH